MVPAELSREESSKRLARALLRNSALRLERADDRNRYVVRTGSPPAITVELPRSLTPPLDNEYAARARWAVVQLHPREQGRMRVVLRRVEYLHGFLSTYQTHHCRCADCTAANAEASSAYRRRVNPPKERPARKHGAQCWKYGCYCEARRAADRERQARHRAKVASLKSRAPVKTTTSSATLKKVTLRPN